MKTIVMYKRSVNFSKLGRGITPESEKLLGANSRPT